MVWYLKKYIYIRLKFNSLTNTETSVTVAAICNVVVSKAPHHIDPRQLSHFHSY